MSEKPAVAGESWRPRWPALRWETVLSSRLLLPAILLITLAVYAPALNDYFAGDDFWFLRSARSISFGRYALDAFDFRQTGTLDEFNRYRPLYPVAWRLQYELFGLEPLGYHLVALALHLGCTALVWRIVRRITAAMWAANVAALVFALHPGYVDAVAWISGGNRVFAAFPYLLSLALFMAYVDSPSRRGVLYAGSLLAFITALLMHSASVSLAVVLPAYVFLVSRPAGDAWRWRSWAPLAPFLLVAGALIGIQLYVRNHLGVGEGFEVGMHQYLTYGRYMAAAVLPIFHISRTGTIQPLRDLIDEFQLLASVVVLVVAVALLRQRARPLVGIFGVWWFFAALFPDTTLSFPVQGRVLYLPGAPFALLVVAAVAALGTGIPSGYRRMAARAAPVVVVAALIPALLLLQYHLRLRADTAGSTETFVHALRQEYPSLPQGSTLFVVDAPAALHAFRDAYLVSSVQTFYGDVAVRAVTRRQATTLRDGGEARVGGQAVTLQEGDHIFLYAPGAG